MGGHTVGGVECGIFDLDVDLMFLQRRQFCFTENERVALLDDGGGLHLV